MSSGLMLAGINGSSILKVHGVESYEGPPALETEKIFKIKFLYLDVDWGANLWWWLQGWRWLWTSCWFYFFLLITRELGSWLMISCWVWSLFILLQCPLDVFCIESIVSTPLKLLNFIPFQTWRTSHWNVVIKVTLNFPHTWKLLMLNIPRYMISAVHLLCGTAILWHSKDKNKFQLTQRLNFY